MKRLLFLTLVLLSGIICEGQKNSNGRHTSLAECGGDTLRYIRVNFLENKERYIGLKVDSLFKDLEIPIKAFGPTCTRYRKLDGMRWSYISWPEQEKFTKKGKTYYYIYIIFKEPYTVERDDFFKIGGFYWREEHRNFMKDFVIKDFLIWIKPEGKILK